MSERKNAPNAASQPGVDENAVPPSFADEGTGPPPASHPAQPESSPAGEPPFPDNSAEPSSPLSETVDGADAVHPGLLASLNTSYSYAVHGIAAEDALEEAPAADASEETPAEGDAARTEENAAGPVPNTAEDAPPAGESAGVSPAGAAPAATAEEGEEEEGEWEDDEEDEEDAEEEEEDDDEPRPMTLRDHLRELRKRLFRAFLCVLGGFFVAYPLAKDIFRILVIPLKESMREGSHFIFTSPGEAFLTYMKVAFVAGFFVTSPLIFYQIWAFVAPGLYKEEKRHILPLAFFSALFFICGGAFCYFVVFPVAFEFFMGFSDGDVLGMPSLKESLNFILRMMLAFGLVFELPLFVFFLARMGLVTAQMMRRYRRYAVLVNVIVAAVLTPPDITSQLLMAGPLLVLYEASILIAAVFGKRKPEPESEDEEEDDEDEEDEPAAHPASALSGSRNNTDSI